MVDATPVSAAAGQAVILRWLGTAGFSIQASETTILHDPYLSRPGRIVLLLGRYRPDTRTLRHYLSADGPSPELAQATVILIGHSHFDHLGDAPWIATETGATIIGTRTTANIARAYGVPNRQIRVVTPGDRFAHGAFEIRVVESRHAKVMFGRVPFDGEVLQIPDAPMHAMSMKMGGALGYLLTHRESGLRLYFLSSAATHPPALKALRDEDVHVLLPAIVGRRAAFTRTLLETLHPRLVVPNHFDDFTVPLERAVPLAQAGAEEFEDEVRSFSSRSNGAVQVRWPSPLAAFELKSNDLVLE